MDEAKISKMCIGGFIVGIIVLSGICLFMKPKNSEIYQEVEISYQGEVLNFFQGKNYTSIIIKRTDTAKVLIFDEITINLNKGDKIEIRGKAKKYQNEYIIIADEIRRVG